jgi:hypothetical protein
MKESGGKNRMITPVLSLLLLAFVSYLGYFGSRYVDSDAIHQLMAKIFGSAYFLSIAFGTLYIFTIGHIRGVPLSGRILASFVVPLVWMSKEVLRLTESHPILECLYWYFNPLNVLLVSTMALEMGIATLLARAILKQRGRLLRVVTPAPVAVILASLLLVISGYAWGKGENVYVIYLNGYRFFFGFGTQ